MNKELYFEATYAVHFSTKDPVPIRQIVDSLLAYESLLTRSAPFLEKRFGGLQIKRTEVLVSHIDSGSLTMEWVIRYIIGDENYDEGKALLAKIAKEKNVVNTVVSMSVGGLIVLGAMQFLPDKKPTSHIEAYNNTIIAIGAEIDFKADDVQAVLDGVRDRKRLAKETVEALSPAHNDPDATVTVRDDSALTMPPELIADIPAEYAPPQPKEFTKDYSNRPIQIYASDRDKQSSGWAGIVPGIVDKRVKFDLWEEVVPSQLHGRTMVDADITVTYALKPNKAEYIPTKVEVRRVHIPRRN